MSFLDSNQWYQIQVAFFPRQSLVGQSVSTNSATNDVSFTGSDNTAQAQRWQVFPLNNNQFILRTQKSSPDALLSLRQNGSSNSDGGSTAVMHRASGSGNEVYWQIQKLKNGGYMLLNVANGTDWHLHVENGGLAMTENTTTTTNNNELEKQKFSFYPIAKIDNPSFSTLVLPSGATATAMASGSTGGSDDSGGLSTGAKAGIGAGVGVAVLLAIILGVFFFLRRRRNKQPKVAREETANHDYTKAELDANPRSPVVGDGTEKKSPIKDARTHELDSHDVYQVHTQNQSPVELPGNGVAELPRRPSR